MTGVALPIDVRARVERHQAGSAGSIVVTKGAWGSAEDTHTLAVCNIGAKTQGAEVSGCAVKAVFNIALAASFSGCEGIAGAANIALIILLAGLAVGDVAGDAGVCLGGWD